VGRKVVGQGELHGMLERLSQGESLLTALHRLLWIAQAPQRPGCKSQAFYPMGPPRRWVDKGDPLFQVRPGGRIVAQVEQGGSERIVPLQAGQGRDLVLREPAELFPEFSRRGQCPTVLIKDTQPLQGW